MQKNLTFMLYIHNHLESSALHKKLREVELSAELKYNIIS